VVSSAKSQLRFLLTCIIRQLVSAASEDLTSVKSSQLSQTKDISRILAALQVANEALRTNDTKLGAVEQEFMSITRRGILGWVYTSVDPSISFNSAIKKREPETGLWFLESAQFIQWTRSVKPLWLTGIRKFNLNSQGVGNVGLST